MNGGKGGREERKGREEGRDGGKGERKMVRGVNEWER